MGTTVNIINLISNGIVNQSKSSFQIFGRNPYGVIIFLVLELFTANPISRLGLF